MNKAHLISLDKQNSMHNNDYIKIMNNGNKIRILSFIKNNTTYHIATNLLNKDTHDINFFIESYKKRWNIEIFFKITKENTSIDRIKTHNKEKIMKEIKSTNIVFFIYNHILNLYYKYEKSERKINNKIFINNFYKSILIKIVKGNLREKFLKYILNIIIVYVINKRKEDLCYPRISIMPYSKWHYKCKLKKIKNKQEH